MAAERPMREDVIRVARALAMGSRAQQAVGAIDDYLRRVDPNDVELLILRGNILDSSRQFTRATQSYLRAVRIDPRNTLAWIDLGDAFCTSGLDYARALRYYNRALRLIEQGRLQADKKGEFVEACVGRAHALLGLNRTREALKCIVGGLGKYPEDALLGEALRRAQQRHEATIPKMKSPRRRRKA